MCHMRGLPGPGSRHEVGHVSHARLPPVLEAGMRSGMCHHDLSRSRKQA